MKRLILIWIVLFISAASWGQNPPPNGQKGPEAGPGMGMGMGPGKLTDQGFTEAEAKAVEADLKAWEQANREWDADLQLVEAQRNQLMVKATLDKDALEKTFQSQYATLLKRDLARIDLMIQWRTTYGQEKSQVLEHGLSGPRGGPPQDQGMGQPGQRQGPKQPNQPQGPGPKNP